MRRLVLLTGFLAAATLAYSQEGGPRITAIEPSFGPTAGGTEVVIRGSGFDFCEFATTCPGVFLTIGGIALPHEYTDTTVQFMTPPHPPGEVEVLFQPPMGPVLRTTFLYTDSEATVHSVIELVDPDRGATGGGTIVVISGFNFVSCGALGTCPERSVTIAGVEPETIEWSNTRIVVRTPSHPPGEVAISIWEGPTVVTTAGFTYLPRAESIPTLSEWAIALLGVLLIVLAWRVPAP